MTVADLGILAIIGISCLLGLWRGFLKEAVSLATWIAAIVAAGIFGPTLADAFVNVLDNESVRRVLAFLLIFVVIMFAGTLLGNLVSKLSSAVGLGGVDRMLGSLFGLVRGVVIVLIILFLTLPFEFSRTWYADSMLVPYLIVMLDTVQSWLGADLPGAAV